MEIIMRIGQSTDIHRMKEGRKLVLGGVEIPADRGLDGHSDADVLVHAIMDALLGGAGLGDIGRHFPDSDEAYRGISSLVLLSRVRELLSEVGAQIVNVDATVVLQCPKIAPYINIMEENVRKALRLPEGCVNIKATTEEHLGFTGREEGAAAHAVAMLRK
jgi:2-C-methyl-D-erythritol 2,4-cyclodiphosphate synthase